MWYHPNGSKDAVDTKRHQDAVTNWVELRPENLRLESQVVFLFFFFRLGDVIVLVWCIVKA